eukprot:COSAG01_NODE_380_length_17862_cov_20.427212_2_plen_80_part_00
MVGESLARAAAAPVSGGALSRYLTRSILTEIHLCRASSCQEADDPNAPGQAVAGRARRARLAAVQVREAGRRGAILMSL